MQQPHAIIRSREDSESNGLVELPPAGKKTCKKKSKNAVAQHEDSERPDVMLRDSLSGHMSTNEDMFDGHPMQEEKQTSASFVLPTEGMFWSVVVVAALSFAVGMQNVVGSLLHYDAIN